MKVTAIILLQEKLLPDDVSWDMLLNGKPILQHVVDNCLGFSAIDEIAVATDCDGVKGSIEGAAVARIPERMAFYPFNFLNATLGRLSMETSCVRAVGFQGDVMAFLPWNMPLLGSMSLERLYHTLLEDMVAARIVPTYPVDPGLHIRLPGEENFFPVWHAPGIDRQRLPQLYRPAFACFSHQKRIFSGVPVMKGLCLPRHEQLSVNNKEHLELAEYILANELL